LQLYSWEGNRIISSPEHPDLLWGPPSSSSTAWDAKGRLQILSHFYRYSISVQALSLFYLTTVDSHFLSADFNCINIDRRLQSEGKIFPAGKVKGKVHPITGHEGPEVE
jgi:hypothetical protein